MNELMGRAYGEMTYYAMHVKRWEWVVSPWYTISDHYAFCIHTTRDSLPDWLEGEPYEC